MESPTRQTRVAFVYLSYRVEVRDIGVGQVGELVEHRQIIGWEGPIFGQDHAPAVPREKLDLVERSNITDKVAFDEVDSMQVEDAKVVGICLSAPAQFPRRAAPTMNWSRGTSKVLKRFVMFSVATHRVVHRPTSSGFPFIPILADPVIDVEAPFEVCRKPAAWPGRDAL